MRSLIIYLGLCVIPQLGGTNKEIQTHIKAQVLV